MGGVCRRYLKYRSALNNLNYCFPDAATIDSHLEKECAICREKMQVTPPPSPSWGVANYQCNNESPRQDFGAPKSSSGDDSGSCSLSVTLALQIEGSVALSVACHELSSSLPPLRPPPPLQSAKA